MKTGINLQVEFREVLKLSLFTPKLLFISENNKNYNLVEFRDFYEFTLYLGIYDFSAKNSHYRNGLFLENRENLRPSKRKIFRSLSLKPRQRCPLFPIGASGTFHFYRCLIRTHSITDKYFEQKCIKWQNILSGKKKLNQSTM